MWTALSAGTPQAIIEIGISTPPPPPYFAGSTREMPNNIVAIACFAAVAVAGPIARRMGRESCR